jgi:hypothetical protein
MNADGVNIRMPSTANLLIDSKDSASTDIGFFTIKKPAALMNGFFTRLAVTEVALDWNEPNISASSGNTITLVVTSTSTPVTSTLPDGNYTVADVLNKIVTDCSGVVTGLNVTGEGANCRLAATAAFSVSLGGLATSLGISLASSTSHSFSGTNLNSIQYLDLTCNDLTYNQQLKDATTNPSTADVVVRWYMAWDTPPFPDQYGFPVEMGYKPFFSRRAFAFPKQIRWNNNQSIGNLTFRTFQNNALTPTQYVPKYLGGSYWMLTILVSEV